MDKTTDLKTLRKYPERYVWGNLQNILDIGDFSIIEDIDTFGEDPTYELRYHPYLNGETLRHSFNTLEEALVFAIARKYDGLNTSAHEYFMRGIGATK